MRLLAGLFVLVSALCVAIGPAVASGLDEQLPDDRVLYIAPGQSLSELVRRVYPGRPNEWARIQRWIVDHNPHAFVDGDPSRLRADVRVRLPHPSALAGEQNRAGQAAVPTDPGRPPLLQFDDRYLFVDPAQTLEDLVPRLYPDARAHWDRIIDAIMARNEATFAASDRTSTLGRGTRLQIPELSVREPAAQDEQTRVERPAPEPSVGEVVSVTGKVTAHGRHGRERSLASGDPIRRHDALRTGPGGRAEVRFRDQERVHLRPGTQLRIRGWRLPEVGPGRRVFELVAGGLRAVTGAIGNREADDYRTITANATMGVRGTRYALRLCEQGECRLGGAGTAAVPPGLYLAVDQGRVALLNAAGERTYGAGDTAYVADATTAPTTAHRDIGSVVYTEAERAEIAVRSQPDDAEKEEPGSSWWWAAGGLLLLGLAL